MEFIVVVIVLTAVIVYQGVQNYLQNREWKKERQELINKLMSKDFTEYANNYSYMNPIEKSPLSVEEVAVELMRQSEQDSLPVGT